MTPPVTKEGAAVMQASSSPIVTADIYDLHPDEARVCDLQFRSFGKKQSFYGPCSTLRAIEDHRPVQQALQEDGKGRVLVVDGAGSLRIGLLGDRLAKIGADQGWTGVIVFGAVRDTLGIDALEIGVKALGATARRAQAPGAGARDVAVSFGGVTIKPGDWVYADHDSVLVSNAELDLSGIPPPG